MSSKESEVKRRSRRRGRGDWLRAEIALLAVVVFCPLAIATVHPWAIATAALLALLACGLAAFATLRSGEPFARPAPTVALLAAALFVGFQLVPLPPALLGLLAPRTRELFEFVLRPLDLYPAWRPLSLDPPATARELAKALTYLAVFLAAVQVSRSRRARTRLVTAIGLSGLAVALVGFGHALWGADTLFGLFHYTFAQPPFLSTFGNPNHLASFLALGATALLSRVLSERDRKIATLWAFAYCAAGVGVLLTLSRGGIVAFVAAQAMLGFAVATARRREREGLPADARSLAVPGAVLVVLAVSAYLAWDALAQELASADSLEKVRDSKIAFWPAFLPLLKAHWLVGVGRGAFEPAFQSFQDFGQGATFTHPENLLFQWTTELGLPMGLFVLGACGWALVGALRRAGGDVEKLACVFGLAAIGLHELVDFGLELGGLAVPASAALAVAVSRGEVEARVGRRTAFALVPVGVAVAVVALFGMRHSLQADGEALAQLAAKQNADELSRSAAEIVRRHPADYYPHLLVAQAWSQQTPARPDKTLVWAGRAMYLNSARPTPHLLAARALREVRRPAQARVEYRLAYERGDRGALKEAVKLYARPEALLELVPDEPKALGALADELLALRRVDEAEVAVRAAQERHGESLETLGRQARIGSARRNGAEVFRVGERMTALAPNDPLGLNTRVNAKVMDSDIPGAIELLKTEGLERFPRDAEIPMNLAKLELGRGNTRGCREALEKLPAGVDVSTRVRALGMEAAAAERDGETTKALGLMRTALAMRPEDAGLRWRYAATLERIGRLDLAVREAETAAAKSPGLQVELERMKKRVQERKSRLEEMKRWRDVGVEVP